MSILISGGGTKTSNQIVNAFFAEKINYGNVLYIPLAGDEAVRSYEESHTYVEEMFREVGIEKADMCVDMSHINLHYLEGYDAIYFSGGSISKLLSAIESNQLESVIRRYEEENILYGQSAGGIIFGNDVSYFEEAKNNTPLNIIPRAILCHYKDETHESIMNAINGNVMCLRDNTAVFYEDDKETYINGAPVIIAPYNK